VGAEGDLDDTFDHRQAVQVEKRCATCDKAPSPDNEESWHGECGWLASDERGILQTALANIANPEGGVTAEVRMFFDNGCNRTYITTALAKKLRLKLLPGETLIVNRFMGNKQPLSVPTKSARLDVVLPGGRRKTLTVSVISKIASQITRVPVPVQIIKKHDKLKLADSLPTRVECAQVDFLLGADYQPEFLTGERIRLQDGLFLLGSPFGWILSGRIKEYANDGRVYEDVSLWCQDFREVSSMAFCDGNRDAQKVDAGFEISKFWDLETIGIKDDPLSNDDDMAVEHFNATIENDGSRYQVKWPVNDRIQELPTNYKLAERRLKNLLKKLKERPDRKYEVLRDYQRSAREGCH
jgi:hypothetical protein